MLEFWITPMTGQSPIFRKLLFSAVLLIGVTLLAVDFYLTRYMDGHETAQAERQLEAQGGILIGEIGRIPPAELENWARQIQQRVQTRITIIATSGKVLADSQHDPESMENHAARPEVVQAMSGQRGIARRHSATLDVDFLYLALPAHADGFVLRLAVPLGEMQTTIAEVRRRIMLASLFAAALSLVVAYLFARALSRRIGRIQVFADGLLNANFSKTLAPEPADELGMLARSLSGVADQLKNMLDALRLEASRREAILASMLDGVLAVDSEMRVTFCNGAFARAVGASMPIAERLPLLELLHDPAFLGSLMRVLVTGEPIRQRLMLAHSAGRVFEVQASPLDDRVRRGVIAIFHDITEIERLERVRRDFVANVSHELRTPLAAIRGYAETLLDGALEDPGNNAKFVQVIHSQAVRLNNIAADLLVLSELESEKARPAPERISIRDAVETALRTVESAAGVHDVRLSAGDCGDAAIAGNRIRLEQALVNLLDNAVKFNKPGGEVRLDVARSGDGKVAITIRDTGSGIPEEDIPRIFERFYRTDKARSRAVGGTGLGLSIVRHVTESMGGTVAVESQLGSGSTFTLLFPEA